MSATVLDMSMSLDGFIAGPNVRMDNGHGDGGERLHDWLFAGNQPIAAFGGADNAQPVGVRSPSGINDRVFAEVMATGAVVAGRGTFEPARGWGGNHHDGVPIFILTRHDPNELKRWPLVTYVDDVVRVMALAKQAPALATCSSTGPVSRSSLSTPACPTSSSSTWSRSCSARAAGCSTASAENTSSWTGCASSKARRASRTCTTASAARGPELDGARSRPSRLASA